ncbi:MAG: hypothetical protein C3F13_03060 [Anaerolineales bacterium]|nr:hypothetical protein [Anaerolineae bacterium]PWB55670.1 MAG: hypothetical protein C3F13_03060 [Anaerolineales bacterium]
MKHTDRTMIFRNQVEWRSWLETHHATDKEAWLLISRKGASHQYLSLEEANEEALCYGWIDGALEPINQETYALRFSPRKPNSIWSVNNQQRVEKLIKEGRMTSAGMEKILEAKESGEWEAAMEREDVSSVPDDLVQALEENDAWLDFENWPPSLKKQYLYWMESAKKPETREKRIKAIVEKAKRGYLRR